MTNLDREIEAKAKAAGFGSLARAILLGYAMAQTGLSFFELFEALLERALTEAEKNTLGVKGESQLDILEDIVGTNGW
jgi:hypothetical protein